MDQDPRTTLLSQYRPPVIGVDCHRCNRTAELKVAAMIKRYGDVTMHELARRVAADGGCALATPDNPLCSARAEEPEIWTWGCLDDARRFGWQGFIVCHRKLEAMKRGKSCSGEFAIDLNTLIAVLKWDFRLDRLPSRLCCPGCGTEAVEVLWRRPPEQPDPGGVTEQSPPLRLRPTRAVMGRARFRVIEG